MRRPRRVPSTIDRLDPEIRSLISELRIDKGWTIDEIKERLNEIGASVSRSALGRHVRTIEDVGADMRESQVYAEALAREIGSDANNSVLQLNAQLLATMMFRFATGLREGEPLVLSTKEQKEFSEALRNIALMEKTKLDVEDRAEKRGEERERKKNAAAVTKVAREKGLSKETVDAIRFAVLGSDA